MLRKRDSYSIEIFLYKVGRYLVCPSKTKKHLLAGLRQELADRVAREGRHAWDSIGLPEEIAVELQENVNPREVSLIKNQKKRGMTAFFVAVIVLLFVLVLCLSYFCLHQEVVAENNISGYSFILIIKES